MRRRIRARHRSRTVDLLKLAASEWGNIAYSWQLETVERKMKEAGLV